jgi:23S rRNA pseudouridine2605 synthase
MSETPFKKGERIAKRMARAGLCSRRDAERWIEEGRVVVNGEKLTTPAFLVTDHDKIVVDGKPVQKAEQSRLWRYHKPVGLVTSHRDEKDRQTVFDALPDDLPRVISVGRLDINSEGLLLLTNDGELARRLELPATGWKRRYRVRVNGHPKEHELMKLAKGIEYEGVKYGSVEATLDSSKGANSWLTISLREGKNREIRKVLEYLGYPVSRLIRISYGPLQLGDLESGKVDEVRSKILRDQMGVKKAPEEQPDPSDGPRRGNRPPPSTPPRRKPQPGSNKPLNKSRGEDKPVDKKVGTGDRDQRPNRGKRPASSAPPRRNPRSGARKSFPKPTRR